MFDSKPKTYAKTLSDDLDEARFDLLKQRKALEAAQAWVPVLESRVKRLVAELEALTN